MTNYEKLIQYLDENQIRYKVVEHAPAASAQDYHDTLHTEWTQQLKSIFVKFKKDHVKQYAICAIPANARLDINKVKTFLGANEVSMGSPDELRQITGCKFGEVPGFGAIFGINLVVDQKHFVESELASQACALDKSVFINAQDYKRVNQDSIADISQ